MGLFSGPRREVVEVDAPERSMNWPWTVAGSTFANATVAGTGALASVAVRSSTDLICSLVSELPVKVYRGDGAEREEMAVPGNIADPGADGTGLPDWTYRLVQSWLHRGNAYGEPVRDRLGYLRGLDLVSPDHVGVTLDGGAPVWSVNGKPTPNLYHSRVNPMAGVLLGFSPVEAHAVTILSSIAASRFGYQWFTDGTHPSSILHNTESAIDADQARIVLDRWRAMKSGTREPAVLGKGWQFEGIDITPEQAQLMGMIGLNEAQACRIFGPAVAETLGYESGGSMTYANVQDRRSDLLVFTLNRWIRRVERLLTSMTPAPQTVQFDRDALLESTTLARYTAYESALKNGWKTINEVRDDEDMPPVEWGDEPLTKAADAVEDTGEPTDAADAEDDAPRAQPITITVNTPDVRVDAATNIQRGAIHVDAPAIDNRSTHNIDASTALLEDSIRVETTVAAPEPAPPRQVVKHIERDADGEIATIREQEV
jgi:HK97 family phage portal protein